MLNLPLLLTVANDIAARLVVKHFQLKENSIEKLIIRELKEMSMITYIGFNFPVKLSEFDMENEFEVEYVCPDERHRNIVQQKHFTTPYIYEILEFENPIWQLTDDHKANSPHNYEKSKEAFLHLCSSLKELLPEGDICEVYICWDGEENEEHEVELKINLNDLQIDAIELYEKCFIRIEN